MNTQIDSGLPSSAGMTKLTNACHSRENGNPVDFHSSVVPSIGHEGLDRNAVSIKPNATSRKYFKQVQIEIWCFR